MKAAPHIHDHLVQFYESEHFLCESVCRFIHEGLRKNAAIVIVARPKMREAVRNRLVDAGIDFDASCRSGDIIALDAEQTLNTFLIGGKLDDAHFYMQIGGMLEQILADAPGREIYAYGEMVDVLWRARNQVAAIRLEELWNGLRERYAFKLLCGYAMSDFDESADGLARVCEAHSHVAPAESYTPQASDDTRAREIVMLQQRVRALESQLAQLRPHQMA
jgi:hypothetical protein